MADSTVVREVKGRLRLDTTDLNRASQATKQFGTDVEQQIGVKAKGHTLEAQTAFSRLVGEVDGLPPSLTRATVYMERMNNEGSSIVQSLGGVGTVATVAGAAVVAFATESAKHYQELAEQVLNYERVTGQSAEASSRMVEVANDLGISSDTLAGAMFRLDQRINSAGSSAKTHTPTLQSLGVAIAHTSDGSVDLNNTLLNVADAYQRAGSGADKDAILFAAFGRSGRDLIPILEQGSSGLRALSDNASNVFTQQQLEQAHQYAVATNELGKSWESMSHELVGDLVPALTKATDGASRFLEQAKAPKTRDWIDYAATLLPFGPIIDNLARSDDSASVKARQHQAAIDQLTGSIKLADTAAQAYNDELKGEADAADKAIQGALGYQQAELSVTRAEDALTAAQKSGSASADQLQQMQVDVEKSLWDAAKAAAENAVQQQGVAGTADEARVRIQAQKDELNKLAGTVSGPVHTALQGFLDTLNAFPTEKTVEINAVLNGSGQGFLAGQGFASGGRPPAGRPYWVGEKGPELRIDDRPGTIIPNGQAVAGVPQRVAEGQPLTINQRIEIPVMLDQDVIGRLVDRRVEQALAQGLRS